MKTAVCPIPCGKEGGGGGGREYGYPVLFFLYFCYNLGCSHLFLFCYIMGSVIMLAVPQEAGNL